jgi:hypothetical protein
MVRISRVRSSTFVKSLECKVHVGAECRLAYHRGATLTEIFECSLLRYGEVLDVAFLDNRKECDQVALEVVTGAMCRSGVSGKHSIVI